MAPAVVEIAGNGAATASTLVGGVAACVEGAALERFTRIAKAKLARVAITTAAAIHGSGPGREVDD